MAKKIREEKLTDPMQHHVLAVTENIKNAEDISNEKGQPDMRELYMRLYKKEPTKAEVNALYNRLNPIRTNPTTKFLAACLNELPSLHNMTLKEFFRLNEDPPQ